MLKDLGGNSSLEVLGILHGFIIFSSDSSRVTVSSHVLVQSLHDQNIQGLGKGLCVFSPNPQSVKIKVCPFLSFPPMMALPLVNVIKHGRCWHRLGDSI